MFIARWSLPALYAIALVGARQPAPAPATAEKRATGGNTEVLVAAAADLRFAMDSLLTVFSRGNPGVTVKPTYGSSGNFFEQIRNGAPFDLFFSADIDYPRRLKAQNKTASDVCVYGTGQLVLWSKTLDPARAHMKTLLDKTVTKIAIANPAHAPYG
ncbi:MAG TPA: molybdate ABC transporter substrate-binding protein, partial [Puia sp.]|nr:molybdate ABC transporter substrate-binding protein [Puia sp.]